MKKSGFSLLELSIVLVIIGLIAGGVMTGQALIRAAELRAVSTEFTRFITANNVFRDKYRAIPGDMKNATAFWGKDNTNCASQTGTTSATGVCNGDGDGIVSMPAPGGAGTISESFQAWRQLGLAGIIEGSYTGIAGPLSALDATGGLNVPASRFPNAIWYLHYDPPGFGGNYYKYNIINGNYLGIGAAQAYDTPITPVLTPAESWNIDKKIDDGKPALGSVIATYWNNQCAAPDSGTATASNLAASYRLSDSSVQCTLMFVRIN